jgi:hypothetical protein
MQNAIAPKAEARHFDSSTGGVADERRCQKIVETFPGTLAGW